MQEKRLTYLVRGAPRQMMMKNAVKNQMIGDQISSFW
jgi:hypothetical protein